MSKKRRTKGEGKKEKRKKKKKKAASVEPPGQSEEESEELGGPVGSVGDEASKEDSDYGSSTKRTSKRVKTPKSNPDTPQQSSNSKLRT